MRKIATIALLLTGFSIIGFMFWKYEVRYKAPTPIPPNYLDIKTGTKITLQQEDGTPEAPLFNGRNLRHTLLHFFDPSCTRARFNLKRFLALYRQYGQQLQFIVVIPDQVKISTAQTLLPREIEILTDGRQMLAKACGVYATPQAVIIDHEGRLYYRGNYDHSNFCTTPTQSHAGFALEKYLSKQPLPYMGYLAQTAYGCELFRH